MTHAKHFYLKFCRKQLRVLFDNVAILDRELVLNRVRDLVNMTLPRWQTSPFSDVEAALTFLYMLGEALPASHGNHFSGDPVSLPNPPIKMTLHCLFDLCFYRPKRQRSSP